MPEPERPSRRATRSEKKTGAMTGLLAAVRARPRVWATAAGALAFVLLAGGAVAVGSALGPAAAADAQTAAAPTPSYTPYTPPPRPVPKPAGKATHLRTCSVAELAQDPRLGNLQAQVVNAKTGEVLFDRNGSTPNRTASVMKVLTSAAALKALGPDYRIPTTVVKGSQPGTVVIVGGGDLTLSRLPSGDESFYTGAAHLDELADQVKQSWGSDPSTAGTPITRLVVDSSLFSGPQWQPSWDEQEERVVEGSTSYITALQVDGDRNDPTALESRRSTDPIGRASEAFARDLGGIRTIDSGTAPAGAKQLGKVLSQPVSTLISQALTVSDNDIMEMLARLVAIKTGAGNTFAAENQGVVSALQGYGIDTTGIHIADGSGLSDDNAVPPSFLTQLFIKILNRQNGLGTIYDALPISGEKGTLNYSDRFTGANSAADGAVYAKTGWIETGYTLAGIVHAEDGTPLTFAVYALSENIRSNAKNAIDTLVTGFFHCGNNLSNH